MSGNQPPTVDGWPFVTNGDVGDDDLACWHVWDRLERAMIERAPELLAGLRPPATEEQLEAAEAELGFCLPRELRYAYLRHDGQTSVSTPPFHPAFFISDAWLPLSDLMRVWRTYTEMGKDMQDEQRSLNADLPYRKGKTLALDLWYPGWLPVAEDGPMGALCVDLNPGEAGVVGQMVAGRGTGDDSDHVVTNSLNEYLTHLTDCLEEGRLKWTEDNGWLEPHGERVSIYHLADVRMGRII